MNTEPSSTPTARAALEASYAAMVARAALEESYQTMTGTQPREPRGPASRPVVALLVAGEAGPAAH